MDARLLTRTAFDILIADLEGHGNVLSQMHRGALLELVDTFTAYCAGAARGRKAFGLPTGLGKTSAIVAFIAALQQLGYKIPVSVAASRVEALCRLKRNLLAHDVPAELVGLKHADKGATEPSTGSESRLFQLVTHARVRSGRDFELFGTHEGAARPLCLYDETLMRADSFAFSELSMRKALACLTIELEKRSDPLSTALQGYLADAAEIIGKALYELREKRDRNANGAPVELPFLDEPVVEEFRTAVRRVSGGLGAWAQELDTLLSVSQESLQVLSAEQGGGVVAVREAVPKELRDVVILDASTPVRELARLDPTVTAVGCPVEGLKSYEAVQVHQLLAAGGRGSIEWSFTAKTKEAGAVAREVRDIIKSNDTTARAFLVFSFLPRRGQVDVLEELRRSLARDGIDLGQVTAEGKPRFEFLTWGNQEGLNGYEHCDVVIMAGVLHRSHLDIAAAVKAQVGHLPEPTPSDRVRKVIESEVAHCVYQGASRGSCRRTTNGKAAAMQLYLIHRNAGLKALLDRVMPGAVWHYPEPRHLKRATAEGRAAQLFGQLLAYLKRQPEAVDKVSSQSAKKALAVPADNATGQAWKRGLALLDPDAHGWRLEAKSLVRVAAESYGFTDRS